MEHVDNEWNTWNKSGKEFRYGIYEFITWFLSIIDAIKSDKLLDPIIQLSLKNLMKPKWFVIFVMKDWIKKIIVLILFHCEWKFSYSTIRWIYKEFLDYSVTNKTGKNKFVSDIGFFKTFFFFEIIIYKYMF